MLEEARILEGVIFTTTNLNHQLTDHYPTITKVAYLKIQPLIFSKE